MIKPDMGTKQDCPNCGARFFDLNRDPITCPACETVVVPEAPTKTRRKASAAKAKPSKPKVETKPPVADPPETATESGEVDAVLAEEKIDLGEKPDEAEPDENEGAKEVVIEDVSELGDDDDDMAEVREGSASEKEDS